MEKRRMEKGRLKTKEQRAKEKERNRTRELKNLRMLVFRRYCLQIE